MKQLPCWGPTNIRRHCTETYMPGGPGAWDVCIPAINDVPVPSFCLLHVPHLVKFNACWKEKPDLPSGHISLTLHSFPDGPGKHFLKWWFSLHNQPDYTNRERVAEISKANSWAGKNSGRDKLGYFKQTTRCPLKWKKSEFQQLMTELPFGQCYERHEAPRCSEILNSFSTLTNVTFCKIKYVHLTG